MVRRHARSRFVPGAYVFPGGKIEDADWSPRIEERCTGLDRAEAIRRIPDMVPPEKALGAWVAAIRETFEEVGILFASGETGSALLNDAEPRFETRRRDLHSGRTTLHGMLERERLWLEAGRLHYFAHWITPVTSPIRYDVRFFVARTPQGQTPCHDGVELTEHGWVTPRDALAGDADGTFPIILPTRNMLAQLSRFGSVDAAIASTRGKTIPAILSKMVLRNGTYLEVMPDEEGDEREPLASC